MQFAVLPAYKQAHWTAGEHLTLLGRLHSVWAWQEGGNSRMEKTA
jgi:hypothetical protein